MRDLSFPKFSIILCNYNHAQYLRQSLPPILGQLRACDELLLVEDGSTDDSLEVMRNLVAGRANVQILDNGRNRGVVWSGNRALAAASGDFVAWWSADDVILDGFLETAAATLGEYPEAGVVASETIVESILPGASPVKSTYRFNLEGRGFLSVERFVAENRARYLWLSSSGLLVRRDALLAHGAWREDLGWLTDWFSVYVTALREGVAYIATPFSVTRARPDSYGRRAARETVTRRPVVARFFDLLATADYADVRARLRRCPLVFSHALGERVVWDLARRPRDWDLLLSVAWAIARARL